jgi:hypothetical protein
LLLSVCWQGIVFYVSYTTSLTVVQSLARASREGIFYDITDDVNTIFEKGLITLRLYATLLVLQYPDIASRTRFNNTGEHGYLSTSLLVAGSNDDLQSMGFHNQHGLLYVFTKHNTSKAEFSVNEGIDAIVSEPMEMPAAFPASVFELSAIHTFSPDPLKWSPPVLASDSAFDVDRLFGPSVPIPASAQEAANFDHASSCLRSSGQLAMWSEPRSHTYLDAGRNRTIKTISAMMRMEPATVTAADGAALGQAPLAFVDIELSIFYQIFYDINLGDSGKAYLFRPSGDIVASSDFEFVDVEAADDGGITGPGTLAGRVRQEMCACGYITQENVDNINASTVLQTWTPDGCQRTISFHGDHYLLQANLLNPTLSGLPWSYVLVTRDLDFFGSEFARGLTIVAATTAGVLVVSILISLVFTRYLSRPIVMIVNSMERLIATLAVDDVNHRREHIQQLQAEWQETYRPEEETQTATTTPSNSQSKAMSTAPAQTALEVAHDHLLHDKRRARFSTHEVFLMQRAYGQMLDTMCSYDQLTMVNDAKKKFIRCAHADTGNGCRPSFSCMTSASDLLFPPSVRLVAPFACSVLVQVHLPRGSRSVQRDGPRHRAGKCSKDVNMLLPRLAYCFWRLTRSLLRCSRSFSW